MSYTFTMNMAGLTVTVHCLYDYTERFCREYLCDGTPDFEVRTSEADIDAEIAVSPYHPKPGYAESICVYRKIAEQLPLYNRMVFHGAVIAFKGSGYLFTAPSGTGKTTHIRLWEKYLDGVEIVNGDKPVLHLENGTVTAYATPYAGKEGYQNHGSTPLKTVCFIHRGTENRIRRVTTGEILTEMMHQVYLPKDTQAMLGTLDMLNTLCTTVPIYLLECDISEEAVQTSFEALTGETYERTDSNED